MRNFGTKFWHFQSQISVSVQNSRFKLPNWGISALTLEIWGTKLLFLTQNRRFLPWNWFVPPQTGIFNSPIGGFRPQNQDHDFTTRIFDPKFTAPVPGWDFHPQNSSFWTQNRNFLTENWYFFFILQMAFSTPKFQFLLPKTRFSASNWGALPHTTPTSPGPRGIPASRLEFWAQSWHFWSHVDP